MQVVHGLQVKSRLIWKTCLGQEKQKNPQKGRIAATTCLLGKNLWRKCDFFVLFFFFFFFCAPKKEVLAFEDIHLSGGGGGGGEGGKVISGATEKEENKHEMDESTFRPLALYLYNFKKSISNQCLSSISVWFRIPYTISMSSKLYEFKDLNFDHIFPTTVQYSKWKHSCNRGEEQS